MLAAAGLLAFAASVPAQESTNTPPPPGRRTRVSPEQQFKNLSEQLKLTEDQKPKVKAVLEDQAKQRQELRNVAPEDRRAKMQALREETTKKFKEILTEDQFKKYEEIQKAQQQRGRPGAGGGAPTAPSGAATKTQ